MGTVVGESEHIESLTDEQRRAALQDLRQTIALSHDLGPDPDEQADALSEDVNLIVDYLSHRCTCSQEQKARKGKAGDGSVDACLPCEIRGAANALHSVAEKLTELL